MIMFKSKWQKRYENVYKIAVFWRDYYRDSTKEFENEISPEGVRLYDVYTAQAIAMNNLVNDMDRIRES